jgi:hypothetical protein
MKVFILEMFINVLPIVLIDQLGVYPVENLMFLNVLQMIIIGHSSKIKSFRTKNLISFSFSDLPVEK